MSLLMQETTGGYSRRHMPQPKTGDGPWGEAIRYWLKRLDLQQADLMRTIRELDGGTTSNTISNASRGLDCHTKTLRIIAAALNQVALQKSIMAGVTLDDALVSPARQSELERLKRMVQEITERVVRQMTIPSLAAATHQTIPQASKSLGQAMEDAEHDRKVIPQRDNPKRRGGRKK